METPTRVPQPKVAGWWNYCLGAASELQETRNFDTTAVKNTTKSVRDCCQRCLFFIPSILLKLGKFTKQQNKPGLAVYHDYDIIYASAGK